LRQEFAAEQEAILREIRIADVREEIFNIDRDAMARSRKADRATGSTNGKRDSARLVRPGERLK
jgi:hypothetical protein